MSEKCEKSCSRDVDRPGIIADSRQEAIDTRERRSRDFSEPVCIHTNQIYSSCRDRDCVTDARVYFSPEDQEIIERAINVKVKTAELIWVYTDIHPVQFNRGYFAVDIKYFVRMHFDVFCGVCNPVQICGLTTFEKRVIMYGAEGSAKVFKSKFDPCEDISEVWEKTNLPEVIVEAVDPIALSAKLVDDDDCCCKCCCHESSIPKNICNCMGGELVTDDDVRQVQVSFGLFSIVMLERKVQLLIDAIDFCIPQNECVAATDDNPCDLFNGIRFPINEFFPPQRQDDDNFSPCGRGGCGCNHNNGCGCSRNNDCGCDCGCDD